MLDSGQPQNKAETILIVDDSQLNRMILMDMLEGEYNIIEASDGQQAIEIINNKKTEISIVLLDIVMPKVDGFGVLNFMKNANLLEDIPVIMISAETANIYIGRAYELGASDFINRPFDESIVHRRIANTIMLYAKQKKLIEAVAEQINEKEESNGIMVSVLSHIVEFRNGESGMHVLHINTLTEILLKHLIQKSDKYNLDQKNIEEIVMASSLHDIGKISIPEEILNKPGRFTPEEYEIMKGHSASGAQMMEGIPYFKKASLVKTCYEICRWHHERYDGNGYPDGLVGDRIPISAQVVSLADVYDALTSKRCYKEAYSHEKALQMILNNECGVFNPILLDCLVEAHDEIVSELNDIKLGGEKRGVSLAQQVFDDMRRNLSHQSSEKIIDEEKMKNDYLASLLDGVYYEYDCIGDTIYFNDTRAVLTGLPTTIIHPLKNKDFVAFFSQDVLQQMENILEAINETSPSFEFRFKTNLDGAERNFLLRGMAIWQKDKNAKDYELIIGELKRI